MNECGKCGEFCRVLMHQIVDAYYAFNLLLHIFGDDRLHAICFISSMFAFNQLLCHTQ